MQKHLQQKLDELKRKVLKMGSLAQYMIETAIYAYQIRNPEFTQQVFEKESLLNSIEIEIDDIAHALLAIAQPVAADMRAMTTVMKINTSLERIGDHAVNIAERVRLLVDLPETDVEERIEDLAAKVRDILHQSLESFLTEDVDLAKQVLRRDDEIDQGNDALHDYIEGRMQQEADFIPSGMKLVRIGHDLERIGDLANNIAEDVVYMKQGKEVRHGVGS